MRSTPALLMPRGAQSYGGHSRCLPRSRFITDTNAAGKRNPIGHSGSATVPKKGVHSRNQTAAGLCVQSRGPLERKRKEVVLNGGFAKRPRVAHMSHHGWWRLAVGGGWRLAVGDRRLVAVGGGWWLVVGGWWLVVGDWWRLAVVGGWRLVAAGGWRRLVAVGGWPLVVPWGGPQQSLNKEKKIQFLKDPPGPVRRSRGPMRSRTRPQCPARTTFIEAVTRRWRAQLRRFGEGHGSEAHWGGPCRRALPRSPKRSSQAHGRADAPETGRAASPRRTDVHRVARPHDRGRPAPGTPPEA